MNAIMKTYQEQLKIYAAVIRFTVIYRCETWKINTIEKKRNIKDMGRKVFIKLYGGQKEENKQKIKILI